MLASVALVAFLTVQNSFVGDPLIFLGVTVVEAPRPAHAPAAYDAATRVITLDPRLKGRARTDVLIHELAHVIEPEALRGSIEASLTCKRRTSERAPGHLPRTSRSVAG
jgi:hypothetical protein